MRQLAATRPSRRQQSPALAEPPFQDPSCWVRARLGAVPAFFFDISAVTYRVDMVSSLPGSLGPRVQKVMGHFERRLITSEDATYELLDVVEKYVDGDLQPTDVDSRRQLLDECTVQVAEHTDVATSFLAHACHALPHPEGVVGDKARRKLDSLGRDDSWDSVDVHDLALVWVRRGWPLPGHARAWIEEPAPPLGFRSWLRYLVARNEADRQVQERLVLADAAAGCPASLLEHLEWSEAAEPLVRRFLGQVDRRALQEEGRWGDLATVAVFLAGHGWYEWAQEWSNLVLDERVPPLLRGDRSYEHHAVIRNDCWAGDARVFPLVALVDFLAGDTEHAASRAALLTRDMPDLHNASLGLMGHFGLADWIRSRMLTDPTERTALLESWYTGPGLLAAQRYADLFELARSRGDHPEAERLKNQARAALAHPTGQLHMGWFYHNQLLHQLPYVKHQKKY